MTEGLWVLIALTAAVSLASPFLLRPLLVRKGVVDIPNARSSHHTPTIRGGGTAPLLAVTIAGGVSMLVFDEDIPNLGIILGASILIAILGLIEDVKGLPVRVRAGTQIVVGFAVATLVLQQSALSLVWIPLLTIAFAANVNFTNFMDGINGISSLHGTIAGSTFAILGLVNDVSSVTIAGSLTAAAFLPFLPWNLARRQPMFLGDVGSYLLGALLGGTAILALAHGIPLFAIVAPLAIYWSDAIFVILRRLVRGEKIFEAHRTHTYQRLLQTGLSHIQVALLVSFFTGLSGAIGILVVLSDLSWRVALILWTVVVLGYLALPRFRGHVVPTEQTLGLVLPEAPRSSFSRPDWVPGSWIILGGTGFIGRHLVQDLRARGENVQGVSAPRLQLDPATSSGRDVLKEAGDYVDFEVLVESLRGADVVINAAGMAAPDNGNSKDIYGANALLPVVLAIAAERAGVNRFIHLSSAAVQGDRKVLDESINVRPFSAYSRSKALGEFGLLEQMNNSAQTPNGLGMVILRATSVQGPDRPTTRKLRSVASTRFSSVAAPGTQPSVVSSVQGLTSYIHAVGSYSGELPPIALQPWEGLSVREVLRLAGNREPVTIPRWICSLIVVVGKLVGRFAAKIQGLTRRLEIMWFGQEQIQDGFLHPSRPESQEVRAVLLGEGPRL